MNARYREELTRLGWPLPVVHRYTVRCRWRPPKDHWPILGPKWRVVTVLLDHTEPPQHAAPDACLYLIATRRGQAEPIDVCAEGHEPIPLPSTTFDARLYAGGVTWGGWIVRESD